MKLKNIKIEKLFGLEQNNFDIELYPEENVTLLYGFNGVGKTSIIKLIDSAISLRITELCYAHFEKVIITFDNDSILEISQAKELLEVSGKKKQYRPISASFNIAEIKAGFSDNIIESYLKRIRKYFNLDSNIIFANRDFNRVVNAPDSIWDNFDTIDLNTKIINCSKLEARKLYDYLKQQFENDIRNNPLQLDPNANLSYTSVPKYQYSAQIEDKLEELNKKIYDSKEELISEEKIALFEDIINNKMGLLYKNVRMTDKELILENIYSKDPELKRNMLSSGEKNIICLFLELIFLNQENSVFFIDEPEASLHVEWQSHLVECILEIGKKYNIQVIITTHAPEVVGEYDGITNEIQSERFRYGSRYFEK